MNDLPNTRQFHAAFVVGLSFVLVGAVAWTLERVDPALQRVVLATIVGVAYTQMGGSSDRIRLMAWGGIGAALLLGLRSTIHEGVASLAASGEWDFLAFYVWGRAAWLGLDFYDPASLHLVATQLHHAVSSEFSREILDVGFFYPPVSMLLFAPLGALSLETARIAWFCLIFSSVIALGAMLGLSVLEQGSRLLRIVVGVALVSLCGALLPTLMNQQTTALVAICVCGILLSRAGSGSGYWAAAGAVLKPIMAIPAVFVLLTKRLRPVVAAAAAGIALFLATIVWFGSKSWVNYLSGDWARRLPPWQFTEDVNQSLTAMLMRAANLTGNPADHPSVMLPYYLLTGVLLLASAAAVIRYWRCTAATKMALICCVALIIYPGTLLSYGLLLTVVLGVMLNNAIRFARGLSAGSIAWLVAFALEVFIIESRLLFWASIFGWIASIVAARGEQAQWSRTSMVNDLPVVPHPNPLTGEPSS